MSLNGTHIYIWLFPGEGSWIFRSCSYCQLFCVKHHILSSKLVYLQWIYNSLGTISQYKHVFTIPIGHRELLMRWMFVVTVCQYQISSTAKWLPYVVHAILTLLLMLDENISWEVFLQYWFHECQIYLTGGFIAHLKPMSFDIVIVVNIDKLLKQQ